MGRLIAFQCQPLRDTVVYFFLVLLKSLHRNFGFDSLCFILDNSRLPVFDQECL